MDDLLLEPTSGCAGRDRVAISSSAALSGLLKDQAVAASRCHATFKNGTRHVPGPWNSTAVHGSSQLDICETACVTTLAMVSTRLS